MPYLTKSAARSLVTARQRLWYKVRPVVEDIDDTLERYGSNVGIIGTPEIKAAAERSATLIDKIEALKALIDEQISRYGASGLLREAGAVRKPARVESVYQVEDAADRAAADASLVARHLWKAYDGAQAQLESPGSTEPLRKLATRANTIEVKLDELGGVLRHVPKPEEL